MTDVTAPESMDEINAQRIAAGLAPIDVNAAATEDEPALDEDIVAAQNYAQRKEQARRAKAEQDTKERIAKVQNQRALNAKLKGSTLGDTSKDDTLDNAAWLRRLAKRQKKREQELAAHKAKEMEEADKAAYDENDLAGLKVGHGAEDFETGEDVILTLADQKVLEAGEDTLQNVNMVDRDKDRAARERKRKALEQYTGYDDEEFDEDRIGRKADILGKYDDEFTSGKTKGESFRLGAAIEKKPEIEDGDTEMIALGREPANKVKLDLNFAKDFEVSDYMKEGDKGFKQRKKRKAKSIRKQDDEDDGMVVEGEPVFERRKVDEGPQNLVDDEDLQAALASKRRQELKKKQKLKPEDIAAKIATQRQEDETKVPEENGDEDGRITFDDTSEFVRNVSLESRAIPVKRERAATPPVAGPSTVPQQEPVVVKIERREEGEADEDEDMDSEDEDEALAEMAAREGLSLAEYRLKIDAQMAEIDQVKAEGMEAATTEEAVAGNGMAGVLNLLRQQGALKKASEEEAERERVQKQRDLWLADYRRRQAQRELERIQARGGNKDQAQREWENRNREMNEARDALEVYKNYKPDINIVYHDEFGRKMTPKEAWKSLSHKFHGKTTGRMKTEKRLKKIADERKQMQMSAGDTPLGMSEAFAKRQVKTGQAHMVLSVGNKGSVQMSEQKPKIRR